MLPDEAATIAYFKHLDLQLDARSQEKGGKVTALWRLHAGPRLFRINGKAHFSSLEKLWLAWYEAQPAYEHLYAQAIRFAEESLTWSADQRRMMGDWFERPWPTPRERDGMGRRIYALRTGARHWPWTVLQVLDARHAVVPVGAPWNAPAPASHEVPRVTTAGLEDPTWRARALVTGRFDMQVPALFMPALQRLLRNAEQVVLDARLQQAAVGAPVLVRRRL
jgi:hypothetical protein